MNNKTDFIVDMSKMGNQMTTGKLACAIFDPKGKNIPSKIVQDNEVLRILYTPFEAGPHTIELSYDNLPVPGSPFVVHVKAGCDPTRVRAFGPGLQAGCFANKKAAFVVETREAGMGGLSLAIEGPSEAKMNCKDNRDGNVLKFNWLF